MTLKITLKVIWRHWVKLWIKTIMMYHHTKFELSNAFHKSYINVQICIMQTFISVNIVHLFSPANPQKCQNWNFDQTSKKMEIMFVYLPNTWHFIHFQSTRRNKWYIHKKTNKYRWLNYNYILYIYSSISDWYWRQRLESIGYCRYDLVAFV